MPIPLRSDLDAVMVRGAARKSKDGAQARRLLALAAIYEGSSRTEAARIGGVTLQIVRDWVLKFNAAGPDGLIDQKAQGKPSLLSAPHRAAPVEAIERVLIAAVHGVVRWPGAPDFWGEGFVQAIVCPHRGFPPHERGSPSCQDLGA